MKYMHGEFSRVNRKGILKIFITEGPIPGIKFNGTIHGAELTFKGVVRGTENNEPIKGIEYTCYKPMAMKQLEKIAIASPIAPIEIIHSIGFVPAGQASLLIKVSTTHSKEAFSCCSQILDNIKQHVPIWKQIIFKNL